MTLGIWVKCILHYNMHGARGTWWLKEEISSGICILGPQLVVLFGKDQKEVQPAGVTVPLQAGF